MQMLDMHCHILPGIDDGARTWEDSLAMARAAAAAGVTHLVATPHYMEGTYENFRAQVLERVDQLRERLAGADIPLEVFPGTEAYLSPDLPARVRAGEVMTVNDGGRHLLVELPYVEVPSWAEDVLFQLQVQGVTPVIAHPERNRDLQRNPALLARWVERGVLAQLDAGSPAGRYGRAAREAAARFLARRLIHMAGSDAHAPHQAERFAELAAVAGGLEAAARACLWGEAVALPAPAPAAVRGWRRWLPAAGGR